jgi:hypothetical protein
MASLSSWQNFYVIVGSAAAALTGLMFVVITLIAGTRAQRSGETTSAFATPTLLHFCAALLIAALISVPWPHLWQAGLLLGLTGFAGLPYVGLVTYRMRHQKTYEPVAEDWIWHALLPFVAYALLLVAAIMLPHAPTPALFCIGAVALLLLFIGIHNAWDTVTYIVMEFATPPEK